MNCIFLNETNWELMNMTNDQRIMRNYVKNEGLDKALSENAVNRIIYGEKEKNRNSIRKGIYLSRKKCSDGLRKLADFVSPDISKQVSA